MEFLTLATFILAFATFALAWITSQSVHQSKRQVDMLIKQTMILRSQNDPIPIFKSFSFDKNKLNITIENIGNGPASSLAVETGFGPAKRTYYGDAQSLRPLTGIEIKEAIEKNKQVTIRYEIDEKNLIENGKKVTPIKLAYLLPNMQHNSLVILPHETCSYTVDLGFGFQDVKGSSGSFPHYDDLVRLLKENDVTCFVLGFRLLGKNMAEDPILDQNIATFIVDLNRHSSIEEAYSENITPPMTIDLLELAISGMPVEREFYITMKSPIYFPKSFEKGESW